MASVEGPTEEERIDLDAAVAIWRRTRDVRVAHIVRSAGPDRTRALREELRACVTGPIAADWLRRRWADGPDPRLLDVVVEWLEQREPALDWYVLPGDAESWGSAVEDVLVRGLSTGFDLLLLAHRVARSPAPGGRDVASSLYDLPLEPALPLTDEERILLDEWLDEWPEPPPPPPDRLLEELLARVGDAPDDDGPREVFADYLTARGDPRGAFVRQQLAHARRADPFWPAPAAAARLENEHRLEWYGSAFVGPAGNNMHSVRGFPEQLVAADRSLEPLVGNPAVQTLRGLVVSGLPPGWHAFLTHPVARNIRSLRWLDPVALAQVADARPDLEVLGTQRLESAAQLRAAGEALARFPRLTRYEVGIPSEVLGSVGELRVPTLRVGSYQRGSPTPEGVPTFRSYRWSPAEVSRLMALVAPEVETLDLGWPPLALRRLSGSGGWTPDLGSGPAILSRLLELRGRWQTPPPHGSAVYHLRGDSPEEITLLRELPPGRVRIDRLTRSLDWYRLPDLPMLHVPWVSASDLAQILDHPGIAAFRTDDLRIRRDPDGEVRSADVVHPRDIPLLELLPHLERVQGPPWTVDEEAWAAVVQWCDRRGVHVEPRTDAAPRALTELTVRRLTADQMRRYDEAIDVPYAARPWRWRLTIELTLAEVARRGLSGRAGQLAEEALALAWPVVESEEVARTGRPDPTTAHARRFVAHQRGEVRLGRYRYHNDVRLSNVVMVDVHGVEGALDRLRRWLEDPERADHSRASEWARLHTLDPDDVLRFIEALGAPPDRRRAAPAIARLRSIVDRSATDAPS